MITDDMISDKMWAKLKSMSKDGIITCMMEAIDSMQSYNGQEIRHCLLETMGATEVKEGWLLPTTKELKKRFQ